MGSSLIHHSRNAGHSPGAQRPPQTSAPRIPSSRPPFHVFTMKTKSAATLPDLKLPDPERDHIFGNPNGEVMILEYGDYECPYCAEAHDAIMQLAELLGDRLCYAYRHFPLINKHPNAVSAAMAAE